MWHVVWKYKYLVIAIAGVCALLAVYVALTAKEIYRAEVVVVEARDAGATGAASLMSKLGGLASIAGVGLTDADATTRESQAVLQSRRLVEEFIKRNDLVGQILPKGTQASTLWFAVKKFQENILSIREDARKGMTIVSIEWTDPATAAAWANGIVALANELIRTRALDDSKRNIAYLNSEIAHTNVVEVQRVMYGLIESETKTLMLANGRIEYAFTVVDPAVSPELRVSPRRTIIVLTGIVLGFFFGAIIALLVDLRSRLRRDAGSTP